MERIKGSSGKNIKSLAGKPLICWTIVKALSSKKIFQVIVSTDCKKIAKISKDNGADAFFKTFKICGIILQQKVC